MSLVKRYGMLSSFVVIGLFGSATAWAVSADALRCTFEVRDETDAVLVSTEVKPQVARIPVPEAQGPEFRETASQFEMSANVADGGEFSVNLWYSHATNGLGAFQTGCVSQGYCFRDNRGGRCARAGCAVASRPDDPSDPDNSPYRSWRPVALFDGIPQFDSAGMLQSQDTVSNGKKTYRTNFQCQHLGTYR